MASTMASEQETHKQSSTCCICVQPSWRLSASTSHKWASSNIWKCLDTIFGQDLVVKLRDAPSKLYICPNCIKRVTDYSLFHTIALTNLETIAPNRKRKSDTVPVAKAKVPRNSHEVSLLRGLLSQPATSAEKQIICNEQTSTSAASTTATREGPDHVPSAGGDCATSQTTSTKRSQLDKLTHPPPGTEKGMRTDHGYQREKQKVRKILRKKPTKPVSSILSKTPVIPAGKDFQDTVKDLGQRAVIRSKQHGKVSVLMCKGYQEMSSFSMEAITEEMATLFPELFLLLKTMMLGSETATDAELARITPRLGMIYSIVMQTRNHELSLLQRMLSMVLSDNICDQKVYDRLNPLGLSLSYCRTLDIVKEVGKHLTDIVTEEMKEGKHLRLIGDNLNFKIGVKDERLDSHSHWVHMFASCALLNTPLASEEVDHSIEQVLLGDLTTEHVSISAQEYEMVRQDIATICAEVAREHLPQLAFMGDAFPKFVGKDILPSRTTVVPLPVLPYNEMKHAHDVKIMEYYKDLLHDLRARVNQPSDEKWTCHVGGDQLTRERFSGAKNMLWGNPDDRDAFAHLYPITFEFFHLGMNMMDKLVFDLLWKEESLTEVGTLRNSAERLCRHNVSPDIAKAYDADRDFLRCVTKAHIIEALLQFFGMDNTNDHPKTNVPPNENRHQWSQDTLLEFVDTHVLPAWSGKSIYPQRVEETKKMTPMFTIRGTDGEVVPLHKSAIKEVVVKQEKPDKVKEYAHLVLELGITFEYFQRLCASPDRARMLALVKMLLVMLKAKSRKAKYPYELFRMLVQQLSVLSNEEAQKVFRANFVNTKGYAHTHIPADQQMEWVVREQKRVIKHMFSRKTMQTVETRSAAVAGLIAVGQRYDTSVDVLQRAKKHKHRPEVEEVACLVDSLRKVRPYEHQANRRYISFPSVPFSITQWFDGAHFGQWVEETRWMVKP